ncbi:O-acetyl-ADP-ribose deacetylase [Natribacillus halophilus]|uniref:O-acetyl-ADP-ribose deacetylase (Regulator of RNase III), contains Macro domain n=1 Tax=Natribacillus halophilus TaxID=549003 RepID=A0A1G8S5Z1_9BACI|nr:O-acetyl-ADP-ribose deacetylase [Natribacillus halophilus]SDJ24601.1 O-acetyl-ADP-ribose deacetylase (regulator of RNase III), contains Macro domain [Natribacillus halophilus]
MKIEVLQEDITTLAVDAIVNAANKTLRGGGGVDGAIHRAGGKDILEECKQIGGCETGEAVITTAGKMPARHIIHTVGPIWNGGGQDEERLLKNCYANSLRLAVDHDLQTIAFPNIGTGVYGFPKDRAARIAVETVEPFINEEPSIEKVLFICFDQENYDLYAELLHG